jgi:flagellar motility protein MotE (MotC chaperone)
MAALGVASFALSFGVSSMVSPSGTGTEQAEGTDAPAVLPPEVVAGTMNEIAPRSKQVEELVRELRYKLAQVMRRERELNNREKRLQMTQDMLVRQTEELETLRASMATSIVPLKAAQADLQRTRITIGEHEQANIAWTATMYDKMDATAAGQTITEMCAGGQTEYAVKLLRHMKERQAASVLAEITDKTLVGRLTELLNRVDIESEQEEG